MQASKPKRTVSAATKAKQEEAANARRMAKLYSNLDAAVKNLNRLIESGKFFDAAPKKKTRKIPTASKPPVFIRKVGAVTITSDEPFDFRRYDSFKQKIKAEGFSIQGRIRFAYTDSQGEISIRTVILTATYPSDSPEYVVGYCELRKEERTFRIKGIQDAIDMQQEDHIADVGRWLFDRKS